MMRQVSVESDSTRLDFPPWAPDLDAYDCASNSRGDHSISGAPRVSVQRIGWAYPCSGHASKVRPNKNSKKIASARGAVAVSHTRHDHTGVERYVELFPEGRPCSQQFHGFHDGD